MTSACVLFYGRRSNSLRSSRTFDDDLASSSSSSFGASSSSSSDPSCHPNRHRNRSLDPHRRHHRHTHHHNHHHHHHHQHHTSPRSPLSAIEPHDQGCIDESRSRHMVIRENADGLARRFGRSDRLPGPVLLAKERLLQRLRGVSVEGSSRSTGESSSSGQCNDSWMANATDWETSRSRVQQRSDSSIRSIPGANLQSMPQEPNRKPLGLTGEAFLQLHHEVFVEHENDPSNMRSKASNECSICLESFSEGNELISLHCGHRFHTSCLFPWVQTCGECPYCRSCIMVTSP